MKRKSASSNPSVVLRAFAPELEFTLSLDGWMLMEVLELGFTNGTRPTTRDLVLAMLIMEDEDAVLKARRMGKLDELIKTATAGKSVGDILTFTAPILAAINAAFEPSDSGAEKDDGTKKPSAEPAGG